MPNISFLVKVNIVLTVTVDLSDQITNAHKIGRWIPDDFQRDLMPFLK